MAPGALSLHADVAHAAPPADVAAGGSEGDPCPGDTLQRAAVKVLRTADPFLKAQRGELAAGLWRAGAIRHVCRADVDMEDAADHDDVESPPAELAPRDEYDVVPDEPSRDPQVSRSPSSVPRSTIRPLSLGPKEGGRNLFGRGNQRGSLRREGPAKEAMTTCVRVQ